MNFINTIKNFFSSERKRIRNICEYLNIKNYKIQSDLSVDVNGDVEIIDMPKFQLSFQFGIISGKFVIKNTGIKTCEFFPKEVEDLSIECNENLESLEGCPKVVGRNFYCGGNHKLSSLKGCPERIEGSFTTISCNLSNLKGGPKEVIGFYNCSYSFLDSLEGAPKECRSFDCNNNNLKSLKYCPTKILKSLRISDNPIESLEGYPDYLGREFFYNNIIIEPIVKIFESPYQFIELNNNYNFIRGDTVSHLRLRDALEETKLEMPDSIKGFKFIK